MVLVHQITTKKTICFVSSQFNVSCIVHTPALTVALCLGWLVGS